MTAVEIEEKGFVRKFIGKFSGFQKLLHQGFRNNSLWVSISYLHEHTFNPSHRNAFAALQTNEKCTKTPTTNIKIYTWISNGKIFILCLPPKNPKTFSNSHFHFPLQRGPWKWRRRTKPVISATSGMCSVCHSKCNLSNFLVNSKIIFLFFFPFTLTWTIVFLIAFDCFKVHLHTFFFTTKMDIRESSETWTEIRHFKNN